MALCKEFDQLSHLEKVEFIGKLVHAVQSSNHSFLQALDILKDAEVMGVFDRVTINPTLLVCDCIGDNKVCDKCGRINDGN